MKEKLIEDIQKICQRAKLENNFKLASVGNSILVDLAIDHQRDKIIEKYSKALDKVNSIRNSTRSINLVKISKDLDIIARELEEKIALFSTDSPIDAVLTSYKVLHRLANEKQSEDPLSLAISLAEDPNITDREMITKLRPILLGLPINEKQKILYVLEKDHNLVIPLEKVAFKAYEDFQEKKQEEIREEREENKKKTFKERSNDLKSELDIPEIDLERSFPTAPTIWSGFAFEGIIPYHQNSQVNFWTLAKKKAIDKIARKK